MGGGADLLWTATPVLGWLTRLEGDSGGRKAGWEDIARDWLATTKTRREGNDHQDFSGPSERSLSPRGSFSCLTRAEGTEVICHFLPPQQLLCLDEQTVLLRKRVAIVSSKHSRP